MRNIVYRSPVKRRGGKGRGEIDLLAVKVKGGSIKDRVRCEVSVSVTSPFPFVSKQPNIDEVGRLVKKFFSKGAELEAAKYLGGGEHRLVLVTSKFRRQVERLLRENLPRFNANLLGVRQSPLGLEVEIEHVPLDPSIEAEGVRKIELSEFPTVLRELIKIFMHNRLMERDFADPIMRTIQWMAARRDLKHTGSEVVLRSG